MRLHPREALVTEARLDLTRRILDGREQHDDLTRVGGRAGIMNEESIPDRLARLIEARALREAAEVARSEYEDAVAAGEQNTICHGRHMMWKWLGYRADAIEAGEEPDWPDAARLTPSASESAAAVDLQRLDRELAKSYRVTQQ